MKPQVQQSAPIHPLTSLRYFAAASIVLLHSGHLFGLPSGFMRRNGALNVMDFFFMLSGFILFYTHPVLADRHARLRFYILRISRIYPLFLVTFFASIVVMPNSALFEAAPEVWQRIVAIPLQLTLTQAWLSMPGFYLIYNGVAWSISCEAFFYLVFPLILVNFRDQWKKWLAGTFLLTIGFMVVVDFLHLPWLNDDPLGTTSMGLFHTHPLIRLSEFVIGMSLGLGLEKLRTEQQAGRAKKLSVLSATLAECFAILFVVLNYSWTTPASDWVRLNFSIGLAGWLMHSGGLVGSALVIFIFAQNGGKISQLLSMRLFTLLGEISYSLYLWHLIFIVRWRETDGVPFSEAIPIQYRLVFFMLFFTALSYLSYRFIERPAKRIAMGYFSNFLPPT